MAITLDELKLHLLESEPEEFLDQFVLGTDSEHFPRQKVDYVCSALSTRFRLDVQAMDVQVVGSAKLGFGLNEKRKHGRLLPRFRPFGPESDIDLAVVSARLFEAIWDELSAHAYNNAWPMPWNSQKLGHYMVHGWLRPDHFPKNVRLQKCDDWWDVIRAMSSDRNLGFRAIRGAPFHSLEHFRRYQLRGIKDCRSALRAQQ